MNSHWTNTTIDFGIKNATGGFGCGKVVNKLFSSSVEKIGYNSLVGGFAKVMGNIMKGNYNPTPQAEPSKDIK